jgi:hypothetical protein
MKPVFIRSRQKNLMYLFLCGEDFHRHGWSKIHDRIAQECSKECSKESILGLKVLCIIIM